MTEPLNILDERLEDISLSDKINGYNTLFFYSR